MDLHAIIPVVRDADAAAAGHPALVALPRGVEYVRAPRVDPHSGSLDLATTPLAPTDTVVDVFGLDRDLFAAANAAKRRVHLCVGGAGTLAAARSPCVDPTPTVCPWVLCLPAFCPCALCNALCAPHEDMDWPPWAAHALVVTENGVVGRRNMRPDGHVIRLGELRHHERDVNAIAWDGFDVDRVEIRTYDRTCYPPGFPHRRTPIRSPTRLASGAIFLAVSGSAGTRRRPASTACESRASTRQKSETIRKEYLRGRSTSSPWRGPRRICSSRFARRKLGTARPRRPRSSAAKARCVSLLRQGVWQRDLGRGWDAALGARVAGEVGALSRPTAAQRRGGRLRRARARAHASTVLAFSWGGAPPIVPRAHSRSHCASTSG